MARGAILAAYLLNEPQPISNQPEGLGVVLGGIDPGDLRFRPQVVGVVEIWNDL